MPVVAVPTDALRRLIGADVDDETLSDLLERLGCDVEGFASVRRIRCSACGTITERTEKDVLPGACPECLTDAGGDVESFWEEMGWEKAIRMDLLPVRPDLFDVGGLARALRGLLSLETGLPRYGMDDPRIEVRVDAAMGKPESYRPEIGCAVVRGVKLDDLAIRAIMKTQEDLHWALGRHRKFASIGVYDLGSIEGPVHYRPVGPEELRFVPLATVDGKALTPKQILEEHPKGPAYRHLLDKMKAYPLLIDEKGQVLSMPPIINSHETALKPETENLFIDVTGPEERHVIKALNVVVTSLVEMFPGVRIEKVKIVRESGEIETPDLEPSRFQFSAEEAARLIGVPIDDDRAIELLRMMRHDAVKGDKGITVSVPAYRNDILHQVDLIEDTAIAIGYNNIPRTLIPSFTLGSERPERIIARKAGAALLGLGFSEAMSLVLTNERDLYERVRAKDPGDSVHPENPASQEQTILRTALAPGLLRLLGRNRTAGIAHKVFEVDDIVRIEKGHEEPVEKLHAAAVIQDRTAGFAEIKSIVNAVAAELGWKIEYRPSDDPLFLGGRGAELLLNERKIGIAGEVHPKVLENFSILVPVTLFEMEMDIDPTDGEGKNG